MIIAIGDIHGKFNHFISEIENVLGDNRGVNFVQVGDFGLGFSDPSKEWNNLDHINSMLQNSDSSLYVIRGNHDNPGFWRNGLGFKFSNIKFIDDAVLLIEDKTCYFMGGAISVDRSRRKQGVDYWSDESYVYTNWLLDAYNNGEFEKIDIVFTHDVYHPCSPYTINNSEIVKGWAERDEDLMQDLTYTQDELKMLYEDLMKINPTFTWYHGHYHESHVTVNDGQITHSLGIFEMKEVR